MEVSAKSTAIKTAAGDETHKEVRL